jgi:hypothetical protein
MQGVRHTFVKENGDTVIRYLNSVLIKGECYEITDKNIKP